MRGNIDVYEYRSFGSYQGSWFAKVRHEGKIKTMLITLSQEGRDEVVIY